MTYPTLMVNLGLGQSNAGLLRVTDALANQYGATVIGIAARQPLQMIYSSGCYVPPELIQADQDQIEQELREAEAEFRSSVHRPGLEWRSDMSFGPPSDYVACQARRADLLLTGAASSKETDATRAASGELVMQSGRPVLVVPEAAGSLALDGVVLAWKDTREARRAALDGLPLMKRARHVSVVELTVEDDLAEGRTRVADVVRWLGGHGIAAEALAVATTEAAAHQLNAIARERGADLIVAGAYGHSRIREWALGGVTRDLLLHAKRCALLSH